MQMAVIALHSSSPPAAAWSSFPNSSGAYFDNDTHFRAAHVHHHHQHHSSASPLSVVGGLTGLFKSNNRSACSVASDGLDCSASGMVRSKSNENLMHWDCSTDSHRGGSSISIPSGSSALKLRNERSPVSVLQGPVASRSSHSNSVHSSVGWDSAASTSGLPPLDRHSRRRDLLSADERSLSSSVGFEVWSDGSLVGSQSRLSLSTDSTATCSTSSSPEVDIENLSRYFLRKDGLCESPEGLVSDISISAEPQELQEARRRLARLALETAVTSRTSNLPLSAEELLIDAQERHKMFFHPLVIRAFEVAEEAHRDQVRRSGGLYLAHCVETAILLANTGADSTVVAAGLLHDTLDDSTMDPARLRGLMGVEIEHLVSGVSKLSTFSQLARDNETAENPVEADRLRTMFLAMVDVRVVLIKLADRLHNLRTLEALPVEKQIGIAQETKEIFAPLANKLGIWSWKAEMEDICFRHLQPQEHKELMAKMNGGWQEGVVMSTIQQLEWALRKEGVEFSDICGRPKNLYSIYSKMVRKGRKIDEIFDVRGLRVIVKDRESCYAALEEVHRLWSHSPRKFKDYIASPKANGYQSLHTVIWGEDGHPLEVQIRTMEMHHQAEYGMAAHWRYKESSSSKLSSFVLQKVEWARWVLTWHSEILDTKFRLSPMKADLKPPCPFPYHKEDCPKADFCLLPPHNEDDPLFVIMLKNDNMTVQELAPGSTAADLFIQSFCDRDSISSGRRSSQKLRRPKVNHQFVDNFQQKLRMGDLVELTFEPETEMVPLSYRKSELTQAQIVSLLPDDKPCGKIALEFQREQLKRLYRDGGSIQDTERGPPSPQETNASVASLS